MSTPQKPLVLAPWEEPKWRLHISNLIERVLENSQTQVLKQPMLILRSILIEAAMRAAELGDPQLISIMTRLTMYDFCDPQDPNYDKERTERTINYDDKPKPAGN